MCKSESLDFLSERIDDLGEFLLESAPYTCGEQKHLDAGTPERGYWHHGYRSALVDVLHMLTAEDSRAQDSPGARLH